MFLSFYFYQSLVLIPKIFLKIILMEGQFKYYPCKISFWSSFSKLKGRKRKRYPKIVINLSAKMKSEIEEFIGKVARAYRVENKLIIEVDLD